MEIEVQYINHEEQRYQTIGDWTIGTKLAMVGRAFQRLQPVVRVAVSRTPSVYTNFLVALHEMVEAMICHANGITTEDVDEWDLKYAGTEDEPGAMVDCPYRVAHETAEAVERLVAAAMGYPWVHHEQFLKALETG